MCESLLDGMSREELFTPSLAHHSRIFGIEWFGRLCFLRLLCCLPPGFLSPGHNGGTP
jgi:hypothetical protein